MIKKNAIFIYLDLVRERSVVDVESQSEVQDEHITRVERIRRHSHSSDSDRTSALYAHTCPSLVQQGFIA